MTRIIVDSTLDLPADRMKQLGIVSVPLKVHFGDEVFTDKVDLDEEQFFDKLESVTKLPTTSQPAPGDFLAAYNAVPKGEPIVSIHIAETLSGTIGSARLAASQLEDRDITIIDSGSVTSAAGLLAMAAAEAAAAGKGPEEIEKLVLEMKPRVRLIAILDTLKYVIMGGRVSRAQGAIGSMLRVKPLMLIIEGEIHRMPPARTWGQAYQKVVEDIREHGGAERIAVIHARAADAMAQMKQILEDEFHPDTIYEGTIGPVVGTYSGPGAVGVAYIAKKAG